MDTLKLVGIAALVALAGLLWLAFIRRVPEESAMATIVSKTFRAASTYSQQVVGADRGFRTPTSIPIAESYVFQLRLNGVADPVIASFNTVMSRQFEVGQRVQVRYVTRGLGPIWKRIMVTDMTPIDNP
jgi:hypothetical protein